MTNVKRVSRNEFRRLQTCRRIGVVSFLSPLPRNVVRCICSRSCRNRTPNGLAEVGTEYAFKRWPCTCWKGVGRVCRMVGVSLMSRSSACAFRSETFDPTSWRTESRRSPWPQRAEIRSERESLRRKPRFRMIARRRARAPTRNIIETTKYYRYIARQPSGRPVAPVVPPPVTCRLSEYSLKTVSDDIRPGPGEDDSCRVVCCRPDHDNTLTTRRTRPY